MVKYQEPGIWPQTAGASVPALGLPPRQPSGEVVRGLCPLPGSVWNVEVLRAVVCKALSAARAQVSTQVLAVM